MKSNSVQFFFGTPGTFYNLCRLAFEYMPSTKYQSNAVLKLYFSFLVATKTGICIPGLGVVSPEIIPDDRITAATSIAGFGPKYARLFEQVKAYCAWPSQDGTLTITFDSPTLVVGLQMRGHPTDHHWVTKFKVRAAGQWLDFTGNTERGDETVGRSFFNNETSTQFSIIPIESNQRKCMRVELFGINEGQCWCYTRASDLDVGMG